METHKHTSFSIVMFPWLGHGHIFPFLELAKRILERKNFHIYFCTTQANFTSIKKFIDQNSLHDSIEILEFHLSTFPHELPPHYHTTKNLPAELSPTLHKAFQASKSSFSDIINAVNPNLVVFDIVQPWASTIASSQGIPAVYYSILSAATLTYLHHHYTCPKDAIFPFPELSLSDYEKEGIDDMIDFLNENVFERHKDSLLLPFTLSSEFVLIKSNRAIEGKCIDYLSSERQKELLPLGPLVSNPSSDIDKETSEIIKWLSKKDEHLTVYIAFGSECFFSDHEIGEIAKGLELCADRVNFIWVIRFPVGEKRVIEEVLPEGFLDRVKERGIVVEGWAPQAHILMHKSTGCFLSHCGWSSINESLCFGVPIIGMPIKLDMFFDARIIVDAGPCVQISRHENNVYRGEEIAKAINEVIVGKKGEELRRKARELGEKMKMEEETALDTAAEKLWRLCLKNKQQCSH